MAKRDGCPVGKVKIGDRCYPSKCEKVKKYFGQTDSFQHAGFIMPDGKMVDLLYKDKDKAPIWQEKHEHAMVGKAYGGPLSYNELDQFLNDCCAVRFRKQGTDGIIRVESKCRPTSEQAQQISKAVKEGCSRFIGIGPRFEKDSHHERDEECSYRAGQPTPMATHSWINKCW